MKSFLRLLCLTMLTTSAWSENMILKDGKTIAAKTLRRQGDSVFATIDLPISEIGKPPKTAEIGHPVDKIEKIEFVEPPILKTAPDMIAQGNAAKVLAELEPPLKFQEGFAEIAGSFWTELALIKVQALVALQREAEAEPLAKQVSKITKDAETVRAANAQIAACLLRRGQHSQALELSDSVLRDARGDATLATASVTKGLCLLDRKDWEGALLAFLAVPVFHPDQKILLVPSMLGAGRSYFGIEDFKRAKDTLNELIKSYPSSPEAQQAKNELELIQRREKALADPK